VTDGNQHTPSTLETSTNVLILLSLGVSWLPRHEPGLEAGWRWGLASGGSQQIPSTLETSTNVLISSHLGVSWPPPHELGLEVSWSWRWDRASGSS
jgi:hypothetical protein